MLAVKLANAQKLPAVQILPVRAPANVKVDGKAEEWGEMKAYNKATSIAYTVANDESNLYLIAKITDTEIASKVIRGGITLGVNLESKKNTKDAPSVTFPKYENEKQVLIIPTRPMRTDSFVMIRNTMISERLKDIGVSELQGLPNGLISLYNDMGIKAAARFDADMNFIYELAVPLKYLGLNVADKKKFNYNVKLTGIMANGGQVHTLNGRDDVLMFTSASGQVLGLGRNDPRNMELNYPTDFWGTYTLIK
ncbi:hypothetical protein GCM10028827_24410 [Mucilaginibacter myungsuensis]